MNGCLAKKLKHTKKEFYPKILQSRIELNYTSNLNELCLDTSILTQKATIFHPQTNSSR
jgi:hypothetical protein